MDLFNVTLYILSATALFILFSKWKRQYWARRGVPQLNPHFLFGDFKPLISGSVVMQNYFHDIYKYCKSKGHKQVGIYNFFKPEWMPLDLGIIKSILTKDFSYFSGHGSYHHEKEPLTMNLFQVEGEQWKKMRTRLTPTFTSGKMKMMFDTLIEKADVRSKVVSKCADTNQDIEIKEIMARFGTDVIGSVAFGIECNSLLDPNNKLRKIGREHFEPNMFKVLAQLTLPASFLANVGFRDVSKEATTYFADVVTETINYREKNNVQRKDFMQFMLQLKNQGHVGSDDSSISNVKEKNFITNQEIITEAFLFYLAGFETSSSATTFALIELAHNQDIQDRLRQEIQDVLEKHNGKLTYEAIMEMQYLDKVFRETLRKYPPAAFLPRLCTKNYTVPGSSVVIEKGTMVHVPTWPIHMDPEYYPNPEEFNPENFTPENIAKRPDFTWMPFGEGPRMCIGLRFGTMQSKVGITTLLKDFKFTQHEDIKWPLEFEIGSFILAVKGNIKLRVQKL